MAKRKGKKPATELELLRDLLIVNLGLAGVRQDQIRKIVGVDIVRVNNIVKHLKEARKK